MFEQKKIPLGIQCFTGCTALVEVIGATGFDFKKTMKTLRGVILEGTVLLKMVCFLGN